MMTAIAAVHGDILPAFCGLPCLLLLLYSYIIFHALLGLLPLEALGLARVHEKHIDLRLSGCRLRTKSSKVQGSKVWYTRMSSTLTQG